jgi:2-methylisocitrate lyase-like PEP mutase family enzyme
MEHQQSETSQATKASKLRQLISHRFSEGKSIICPTAHDCVTAKMWERAGCEFINVAGAAPTAVWTGEPECGVVTMTELANAAYRILSSVEIPGKVNIAQGGNALNVVRATREYEHAGAALMQIEDQASGHFGGFVPGKQVISIEEMAGRIQAACYAREDRDILVAARTDAKLAVNGGIQEMIKRCHAYVDAGAELLMPHGIETIDEWRSLGVELRKIGVPLIASLSAGLLFTPANQPRRDLLTPSQLADMGWTVLAYANHVLHIQMTVARDYMRDLMTPPHDISRWFENMMDNGERMAILGMPEWRAIEEIFMPREHTAERYSKVRPEDSYVYDSLDEARRSVRATMKRKGVRR